MKQNSIQRFFINQNRYDGDCFSYVYDDLIKKFKETHIHMLMKRLLGMTWKEIGEEYGVSLQYAHRSVDRIKNELRDQYEQKP